MIASKSESHRFTTVENLTDLWKLIQKVQTLRFILKSELKLTTLFSISELPHLQECTEDECLRLRRQIVRIWYHHQQQMTPTDKCQMCHWSNWLKLHGLHVCRTASVSAEGVTVEQREAGSRTGPKEWALSETEPDKRSEREMKTRWRRKPEGSETTRWPTCLPDWRQEM